MSRSLSRGSPSWAASLLPKLNDLAAKLLELALELLLPLLVPADDDVALRLLECSLDLRDPTAELGHGILALADFPSPGRDGFEHRGVHLPPRVRIGSLLLRVVGSGPLPQLLECSLVQCEATVELAGLLQPLGHRGENVRALGPEPCRLSLQGLHQRHIRHLVVLGDLAVEGRAGLLLSSQRGVPLGEEEESHDQPGAQEQEPRARAPRQRRIALRPPLQSDPRRGRLRGNGFVLPDSTQVLGEFERALVPAVAVLFEGGLEDHAEVCGHRGIQAAGVGGVLALDRLVEALSGRAVEGALERQALVEGHPQGPDVGAAVEVPPLGEELLGGHVGRRPEEVSADRQRRALHLSCKAEVHQQRVAFEGHHDVPGLHVSVDDPRLVRGVQCPGDSLDQLHGFHHDGPGRGPARSRSGVVCCLIVPALRQMNRVQFHHRRGVIRLRRLPGALDLPRQAHALDVGHHDVGSGLVHGGLVDGADPGVVELGGHLRLPPKSLQRALGEQRRVIHDLDRHPAIPDLRVLRQVHDGLPATSQLLDQPVVADLVVRLGGCLPLSFLSPKYSLAILTSPGKRAR